MHSNTTQKHPIWCTHEAGDAEEQAENLRNWQQQYAQMSSGKFYGCIKEMITPEIHLFHEYTNQRLIQHCNVWPDALWLGFSADEKHCKINRQEIKTNQLMLRPGDCDFELITPENFNILGIVVRLDVLRTHAAAQQLLLPENFEDCASKTWQDGKVTQLRNRILALINPVQKNTNDCFSIIDDILELFSVPDNKITFKVSAKRKKNAFDTVVDLIDSHPEKNFTITELCEKTYMSRRSLQYCIEENVGLSPVKFIKWSKLNRVRKELLKIQSDELTIFEIAQGCGFTHAGQFSKDYKTLFGETPSQTLAHK
ncbi:helix-turn-helix domain-containing protein [Sessilibacter sp. MAH1]